MSLFSYQSSSTFGAYTSFWSLSRIVACWLSGWLSNQVNRAAASCLYLTRTELRHPIQVLFCFSSSNMAEIPHSRQRRVYTGCLTCRIRKVKCDEAKPTCARCNSSRRQCDGYSALPFSRADLRAAGARRSQTTASFGLVSALLTDTTFANTVERRYFHFFRTYTVPSTTLTVSITERLQSSLPY